jgi:predicted RNase H-like nuclease (RuvC/YqgF family)
MTRETSDLGLLKGDLEGQRRVEQLEEMWRRIERSSELQRKVEQLEEIVRREREENKALQGNYQESQGRVEQLKELLGMTQEYCKTVLNNLGSDINLLLHQEEEHSAKNGDDIKFSKAGHLLSSSSNASSSVFSTEFAPPKMEVDSCTITTSEFFQNRVSPRGGLENKGGPCCSR